MKFLTGEWTPATIGRHGEYLMPLTATFMPEQLNYEPDFDLIVESDMGAPLGYVDFQAKIAFILQDQDQCEPGERECSMKLWKSLQHALQDQRHVLYMPCKVIQPWW